MVTTDLTHDATGACRARADHRARRSQEAERPPRDDERRARRAEQRVQALLRQHQRHGRLSDKGFTPSP